MDTKPEVKGSIVEAQLASADLKEAVTNVKPTQISAKDSKENKTISDE